MVALSVAIILGFLLIYILIGIYSGRVSKATMEDYILAGRGFGNFVAFFAVSATWISVVFYLGGPGWFYQHGYGFAFVPAYCFIFAMGWLIFGKRMCEMAHDKGYLTQGDLVEDYHGSRAARYSVLIVGLICLIPYIQTQFLSLGYIASAATLGALSQEMGAFLGFVVVVFYIWMGGMRATAWTNVLQGILMFIGLAIIAGLWLGYYYEGSVAAMFEQAATNYPAHLTLPGGADAISASMWSSYIFVFGLGAVFWPHLVMRSFAVKSPRFFNKYPLWIFGLYIIIVPAIIIIGLGGRMVMEVEAVDRILPELLVATIPLPLAALLLCGAVAGSMSTVDGQNHAIASMLTHDFIRKTRVLTEERSILITRILVVVVAGIGLLMGFFFPAALYDLAALSSGLALVIAPSVMGALVLWKRATAVGAIASLWVGLLVVVITEWIWVYPLAVHSGVWGFVFTGLTYIIISLVTTPPEREPGGSVIKSQ